MVTENDSCWVGIWNGKIIGNNDINQKRTNAEMTGQGRQENRAEQDGGESEQIKVAVRLSLEAEIKLHGS